MTDIRPRFDPTLNWGHILTAMSFFVFGIGAYYSVKADIDKIEYRQVSMEVSIRSMTETIKLLAEKTVTDARQDERLTAMDRRIDRLEGQRVQP